MTLPQRPCVSACNASLQDEISAQLELRTNEMQVWFLSEHLVGAPLVEP